MSEYRLRTERRPGVRFDQPARNIPRVLLDVDVIPVNGTGVFEQHHVHHGEHLVEQYADQLSRLLADVWDETAEQDYKLATRHAETKREQWMTEHRKSLARMTDSEREKFIKQHCNIVPETFLSLIGRKAWPRLKRCQVVALDGSRAVDLADFLAMDEDKQAPFLMDPPETDRNRGEAQGRAIAAQLAAAFKAMPELFHQDGGGNGRGKRRNGN